MGSKINVKMILKAKLRRFTNNAIGTVGGLRPLSYRQYCRRYAAWCQSQKIMFHIQRYPGINLELDFAGKTLLLHDRRDPGLTTKVTIFVAAL